MKIWCGDLVMKAISSHRFFYLHKKSGRNYFCLLTLTSGQYLQDSILDVEKKEAEHYTV